jgi:hypothetical protein
MRTGPNVQQLLVLSQHAQSKQVNMLLACSSEISPFSLFLSSQIPLSMQNVPCMYVLAELQEWSFHIEII